MSDRFVLTAELQLRAPTNTAQVMQTIQQQLNGVNIPVIIQGVPATNKALGSVEQRINSVSTAAERMGKSFGVSLRRFAAFSIANRAVGLFTTKTAQAIEEAIEFERELVKISQVTGKTVKELGGLTQEVTRLSTELGTSSKGLLGVARILSQAGIQANDLEVSLSALAKTTLAPTFEDIEKTAEGAVAVLAQFGQGVGALETQLGSINAVAGQFAVESGDLISAVRRTGGVFKSAGGDLNELLALFTSVRATTRESAESIATGMRTIFTRIQRPQTIEYMKQFGVELTDLEGRFVGPFEAIKRLSEALSSFETGDIRFVKIAEELGGFRQIGKVLPLIQKFELAEKARQAALDGGNSLTEDTITAQQSLAVQFTKVREEFLALARSMTETSSFRVMIQTLLNLSSSLISLSESFKPILPILGALAAIKIARGIGSFAAGIGAGLTRHSEGGPIGFNTGGLVPGQGNRDTVPAMLTPGEFVIKKKSVESIGLDNLQRLNTGGLVKQAESGQRTVGAAILEHGENARSTDFNITKSDLEKSMGLDLNSNYKSITGKFTAVREGLGKETSKKFNQALDTAIVQSVNTTTSFLKNDLGINSNLGEVGESDGEKFLKSINPATRGNLFEDTLRVIKGDPFSSDTGKRFDFPNGVSGILKDNYTQLPNTFVDAKASFATASVTGSKSGSLRSKTIGQMAAEILQQPELSRQFLKSGPEKGVETSNLQRTGSPFAKSLIDKSKTSFSGLTLDNIKSFSSQFPEEIGVKNIKASDLNKMIAEGVPGIRKERSRFFFDEVFSGFPNFAKGGGIASSDTVPALLTPGEFVINRDTAKRVGYNNLRRMNKLGVQGFNKGGVVGVQRFNEGDEVLAKPSNSGFDGGGGKALAGILALQSLPSIINQIAGAADENSSATRRVVDSVLGMATSLGTVMFALQSFGVQLKLPDVTSIFKGMGTGKDGLGNKILDKLSSFKTSRANKINGAQGRIDSKQGSPFSLLNDRFTVGASNLGNKIPGSGKIGSLLKSFGGALGKAGGFVMKLATGPLATLTTGLSVVNTILNAYQDNLGKYNDAVEEGNVAKAQELAVLKETSGISNALSGWIPQIGKAERAMKEWFGGPTSSSLKALAKSSALASKFQLNYAKNAKAASRVLADIEAGRISASQAIKEGGVTKNFTESVNLSNANKEAASNLRSDRKNVGFGSRVTRDVLSLGGLLFNNSGQQDRAAEKQAKALEKEGKEKNEKEFEALGPVFRQLTEQMVHSGAGMEGFNEAISKMGLTQDQIDELTEDYKNQSKAIRENIEHLKALNFGLRSVSAISSGTTLRMEGAVSSSEIGNNPYKQQIAEFKAAMSNVSSDMTDKEIGNIQKNVGNALKLGGASDNQVETVQKSFKAITDFTKGGEKAFEKVKEDRKNKVTPSEIKDNFIEQIIIEKKIGEDEAKRIRSASANIDMNDPAITEAIERGDYSKFADALTQALGQGLSEDVLPILEEISKQEDILLGLTREKNALTNKHIDSLQRLASIKMEAASIKEEFTGVKTSPDEKRQLITESVNPSLKAAGIKELDPKASTKDISDTFKDLEKKASAEQQNRLNAVNAVNGEIGAGGNFNGNDELSNSTLESNIRANEDLLKYTQERIGIVREELALARKKTELERSSIDKLASGDFEGYLKGQEAAAAQDALMSGNNVMAGQFSQEALKTAFDQLKAQGVEQGKLARAAQIVLGPFANQRNIDLMTGRTEEEKPLIDEAVELAGIMPQAGENLAKIDKGNIEIKSAVINIAKQARDNAMVKRDEQNEKDKVEKEERAKEKEEAKKKEEADKAKEKKETPEEKDQRIRDAQLRSSRQTRGIAFSVDNNTQPDYSTPITEESMKQYDALGREEERKRAETAYVGSGQYRTGYASGGTVYANNGMFVPRGTDTVPAMLTPGEFVVNRGAVQRGNNLQLLRAMNGGDGVSYNRGVQYRQTGGSVQSNSSSISIDYSNMISSLDSSFSRFAESVDKLAGTKLQLSLDTTNVNVNFNGTSFLSEMTAKVKDEIMDLVISKIRSIKHATNGTHIVD